MDDALRELQLCELEILKEIKRICKKYNIRFVLASGTLLGAVRHQGFIPWDDDIDIEMPYRDYQKFQEIAQAELGEAFSIQNTETDPYYSFPYLRVQKRNTTLIREWEKELPGNHRVWIDVFPLVSLGSKTDYHMKRLIIRISTFLRMHPYLFEVSKEWYREQSNDALILLIKMARSLPEGIRLRFDNFILRHFVFSDAETKDVTFVWTTVTRRLPRRIYEEPDEQLWFEDDYYPVPKGYDEYLKILYKNYMEYPPEEKRLPVYNLFFNLEQEWNFVTMTPEQKAAFEWKTIEGQSNN